MGNVKFRKRMLCLASDKMTRILYLKWLKASYRQLPRFLKQKGMDFMKTLSIHPQNQNLSLSMVDLRLQSDKSA
jgi:hypothetical protein